ncbi:phosphopantothenoylcysteine decarboxylase/phosphopantothenate--cysteine ligase [Breznakia blatticola]|uniref:Coenzyme A biosynthesis bifunctional protein CoaBC n=1 Tax=Breznakia blatticola TaxID=1754012 RepID=A0A4V3G905_9FIRM|nr:bifunctional phosphopantothenoylcysteine decarboxylase/phosphopantothenate--cysteine ligase CoaBC [Breznakia blatticola]TDW24934.1 phosphopantothenoylcysteine decarboxylase/phosphopantothenate--cysteine ligase [Breznakia blatticola]
MKPCVVVGVTSSIATFKAVQLVSDLLKKGYDVEVIMSKNATKFVDPLTFSSLTKHKTYVHTFDRVEHYDVEHISLAKKADVFILAPATANVIAKVVHGLADDMLSTTFLAANCPKLIAPAMNTQMYNNPVTQENLTKAKKLGYHIIEPCVGLLACGDTGTGKLADIPTMIEAIEMVGYPKKILTGKRVLVSAGPTREALDPVRFISNHSSGKMGYAIAKAARNMGASVTLVSGPVHLSKPYRVDVVDVVSAADMFDAMTKEYDTYDYVIMAAAVADYTPKVIADQKIKKDTETTAFEFVKTKDILQYLGDHKSHQKLCGFAMESENMLENARKKFEKKHCDLLVANNIRTPGAGFDVDTNIITLINRDGNTELSQASKEELAYRILETLCK